MQHGDHLNENPLSPGGNLARKDILDPDFHAPVDRWCHVYANHAAGAINTTVYGSDCISQGIHRCPMPRGQKGPQGRMIGARNAGVLLYDGRFHLDECHNLFPRGYQGKMGETGDKQNLWMNCLSGCDTLDMQHLHMVLIYVIRSRESMNEHRESRS